MWFKAISLFRLDKPFQYTPERLETLLEEFKITGCGKTQHFTFGWTSPFEEEDGPLVHAANGYIRLVAEKCERVLPASVIAETVKERLKGIRQQENREPTRKEKLRMKDEVTYDLLPKAFVRKTRTQAYLDPHHHWLIVDTSSRSRAEELVGLLRDTLGTLPMLPLTTPRTPMDVYTQAIRESKFSDDDFKVSEYCAMINPKTGMGLIRCDKQNLFAKEIHMHLDSGKALTEVSVCWQEKISFVCDHNLQIKRLKFIDITEEKATDGEDISKAEQLDAEFALMSAEFTRMLENFFNLFGGLQAVTSKSKVTTSAASS